MLIRSLRIIKHKHVSTGYKYLVKAYKALLLIIFSIKIIHIKYCCLTLNNRLNHVPIVYKALVIARILIFILLDINVIAYS